MKKEKIEEILFLCEDILNWSKSQGWFDKNFVIDIYERLNSGLSISGAQEHSIRKIHNKFIK